MQIFNSDMSERSVLQVGLHALTFSNCVAPVGEDGGVLQSFGIVTVIITDCNFNNNRATRGGALSVTYRNNPSPRRSPILMMSGDNIFFNNSASRLGGAIYSNYSVINITGTVFQSNAARVGGGVYWLSNFRMGIAHSSFKSNTAIGGGADGGSAIYSTSASSITIDDVTFESNFASSPGTIALYFGPSATITRSTFRYNQARGGGGGVFCGSSTRCIVSSSSFTSNNGFRGGGIMVNSALLTASQLIMTGNTAAFGGAMYFANARGSVSTTQFDGNVCEDGAAVYAMNECSVTLSDCSIKNNHARDDGSGLFCDKSTFSLTSITFSNNTAGTSRSSSRAQDVFCDTAESNGYCYIEGDAQWNGHCKLVRDTSPKIPLPKWLLATIIGLSVFVFLLIVAVAFWMYRVRRVKRENTTSGLGEGGYVAVQDEDNFDDESRDTQLFGVITNPDSINRTHHSNGDDEEEDRDDSSQQHPRQLRLNDEDDDDDVQDNGDTDARQEHVPLDLED